MSSMLIGTVSMIKEYDFHMYCFSNTINSGEYFPHIEKSEVEYLRAEFYFKSVVFFANKMPIVQKHQAYHGTLLHCPLSQRVW